MKLKLVVSHEIASLPKSERVGKFKIGMRIHDTDLEDGRAGTYYLRLEPDGLYIVPLDWDGTDRSTVSFKYSGQMTLWFRRPMVTLKTNLVFDSGRLVSATGISVRPVRAPVALRCSEEDLDIVLNNLLDHVRRVREESGDPEDLTSMIAEVREELSIAGFQPYVLEFINTPNGIALYVGFSLPSSGGAADGIDGYECIITDKICDMSPMSNVSICGENWR